MTTKRKATMSEPTFAFWISRPLVTFAIIVTFINDHLFKVSELAGLVTGKLSDFAGLFFLPFLILDLLSLLDAKRQKVIYSRRAFIACLLLSTSFFVAIKTSSVFLELFKSMYFEVTTLLIHIVQDPTDLLALIVVPIAYFYFCKHRKRSMVAPRLILILFSIPLILSRQIAHAASPNMAPNSLHASAAVGGAFRPISTNFTLLKELHLPKVATTGWSTRFSVMSQHRQPWFNWFEYRYGISGFYSQVQSSKKYQSGSLHLTHKYLALNLLGQLVFTTVPVVKPFVGLSYSLFTFVDAVELDSDVGSVVYNDDGLTFFKHKLVDVGVRMQVPIRQTSATLGLAFNGSTVHHWYLGLEYDF